jgi:HAD superfamily hydrolase (TIGR01509 family)
MGRSLKSCVEIVEAELGRKLPDDFVESMQAVTYQSFRDAPLQAVTGVKEAVLTLQAGRPRDVRRELGLAGEDEVHARLTGLWELFDGRIFSAGQVPRGKPFPDLFLHAAIAMNEQPFDTVVVEDSVPRRQAARSAGMRALAYAGAPYADRAGLSGRAGLLFDAMNDLPRLVLQ